MVASQSSPLGIATKPLPLAPNYRPQAEPIPTDGRSFSTSEPKLPTADHSFFDLNNSTHSLLSHGAIHETHRLDPFGPGVPRTSSPAQLSSSSQRVGFQRSNKLKWEVLLYLARKTGIWVLAGVTLMFLGIGLTGALILPRIHSCPAEKCPGSFDPNTSNVLQLLQVFMSYWLKAGVMISSIGMLKLSAYQAWFILIHQGNTVNNLDLILGAIRGSVVDAGLLLLRKNNRLLSLFLFGLIGIGTAISLVTGLSIKKEVGVRTANFAFNGTSRFPDSSLKQLNSDGQLLAIQKVIQWALQGDETHGGALKGTMVVPGARSAQGSQVVPGGPKITGRFLCEGWGNYTIESDPAEWHIWINNTRFVATQGMSLDVSFHRVDTAVTSYLWVSNTTGLIPNATQTSDGVMNIALCTHWLEMEPGEPDGAGVRQVLTPSAPSTSGCDSSDANTCVADSVNNAILNWWGGVGSAFWHISCRGGVLGPMPSSTDAERYCPLTQDLWTDTATSMLDGIVQTAPTSVLTTQDLDAYADVLDGGRWWLHAVIPVGTVVLYLVGLVYTCALSEGEKVLKELNLEEVVRASQTDHVHALIATGQLNRAVVRYDSNIGFVHSYTSPMNTSA